MTPLDTSLLLSGYLRTPDGRLHFVHGLDIIARDILLAGAEVWWGDEDMADAGRCDCRRRRIILAPWLCVCSGPTIRLVAAHELAHTVVGPSDERCRRWSAGRYQELLTPVWAA